MSKTKILCIDDERSIRFALSRLFSLQGWETLEAENSEQGVEIFERERPDLVLVDYHMPGENGVETVKRLRRISAAADHRVYDREQPADGGRLPGGRRDGFRDQADQSAGYHQPDPPASAPFGKNEGNGGAAGRFPQ